MFTNERMRSKLNRLPHWEAGIALATLVCDVDEADFAQLLATWSGNATCRIVNFCPDAEGGEGFAGEPSLIDQMNAALETMGFSSAEEYLNWASSVDPADAENMSYLIHVLMTE